MKMVRNWIVLILVFVAISVALFITGRQHSIYFENKEKAGYEAIKDISFSLNGEKAKKVRVNRRGLGEVKGRKHELVVEYKDTNGQKQVIKENITLGPTENIIVYLPILVNGGENWMEEFQAK